MAGLTLVGHRHGGSLIARLVALQLGSAEGLVEQMDAAWADGDAVLPIATSATAAELDRIVARLRPAVVRRVDGSTAHHDAPPVPDGTAVVVATSGSTGVPRGVVLSHTTLAASVDRSRRRLGAGPGEPWLGVLPMTHVAGITVLLRARAAGVEPLLHDGDRGVAFDAVAPSWISLVPTQLDRLLDRGVDLARHRGVLLGGARADPMLLRRARHAGVAVVTSYGMTETAGGCVYDGVPLDDVEAIVSDDGVLQLRGPVVADGLREPDGGLTPLTDAQGWLHTADLGEVTPSGRVVVNGRADDVVVSGGENVPLAPVRRAVRALTGVAEADVVGLPDRRWGTAVTAVVVPAPDGGHLRDVATLRDALRGALPPSHRPTRLLVVDSLPRDTMGKVTPRGVAQVARTDRDTADDPDR